MQLPAMGCLSTFANGIALILICIVLGGVIVGFVIKQKSRNGNLTAPPEKPSVTPPKPVEPSAIPEPVKPVDTEAAQRARKAAVLAAEREVADVGALLEKERAILAKLKQDGRGISAYVDARARMRMYEKGKNLSEANAKEYAQAEADLKKAGSFSEPEIQAHLKELKKIQGNIEALQERERAAVKALNMLLE